MIHEPPQSEGRDEEIATTIARVRATTVAVGLFAVGVGASTLGILFLAWLLGRLGP